jgi:hypothetical protein
MNTLTFRRFIPGLFIALVAISAATLLSTSAADKDKEDQKILATLFPTNYLDRFQIQGEWEMVSRADTKPLEYGFAGQVKMIGAKRWAVFNAEKGSKTAMYFLSGTYRLNGDDYVETVEYTDSDNTNMVGNEYKYKITVKDDKLTQLGLNTEFSHIYRRVK